jgi:hypothetical protein
MMSSQKLVHFVVLKKVEGTLMLAHLHLCITELKVEKKNAGALPFVTSTIFFLYDKLVVNIA